MDKHVTLMADLVGLDGAPITAQLFGNAATEYMKKNNIKPETLAKIAYKNHKHSVNNPLVLLYLLILNFNTFHKKYFKKQLSKNVGLLLCNIMYILFNYLINS